MTSCALYVRAARLSIDTEPYDKTACREISRIMLRLERTLICAVCGQLLRDPYSPSPIGVVCEHHVCRMCLGGHKRSRTLCKWCRDYEGYVRNPSLRSLLVCYKGLCEYIKHSPSYPKLNEYARTQDDGIVSIVESGAALSYFHSGAVRVNNRIKMTAPVPNDARVSLELLQPTDPLNGVNESRASSPTYAESMVSDDSGNLFVDRSERSREKLVNGDISDSLRKPSDAHSITRKGGKNSIPYRPMCSCGRSGVGRKNKATCSGHRCQCFMRKLSCAGCRCKGCLNPYVEDGSQDMLANNSESVDTSNTLDRNLEVNVKLEKCSG